MSRKVGEELWVNFRVRVVVKEVDNGEELYGVELARNNNFPNFVMDKSLGLPEFQKMSRKMDAMEELAATIAMKLDSAVEGTLRQINHNLRDPNGCVCGKCEERRKQRAEATKDGGTGEDTLVIH